MCNCRRCIVCIALLRYIYCLCFTQARYAHRLPEETSSTCLSAATRRTPTQQEQQHLWPQQLQAGSSCIGAAATGTEGRFLPYTQQ